jgi:hypothetical protein
MVDVIFSPIGIEAHLPAWRERLLRFLLLLLLLTRP